MNRYTALEVDGYEKVVRCDNQEVGFTAWIAVHNTHLGPALGGCRVWQYGSNKAALTDVLRLSKGMTYKNALAKLPLGGGKSVVNANLSEVNRKALFLALGEFVEQFGGVYITAEDVNTTVADVAVMQQRTNHVATVGASGNPSPFTAYGVYCAMKASVRHCLGLNRLDGLTVAIQGVGETGGRLAQLLAQDNCSIVGTDINENHLRELHRQLAYVEVEPDDIYSVDCDIFAPCALGGILNDQTIPKLRCRVIAGSANNQLLEEYHGEVLRKLGILYAPDYAANAGGVINISCELNQEYAAEQAYRLTNGIEQTLRRIFIRADYLGKPTNVVANQLAEELFNSCVVA